MRNQAPVKKDGIATLQDDGAFFPMSLTHSGAAARLLAHGELTVVAQREGHGEQDLITVAVIQQLSIGPIVISSYFVQRYFRLARRDFMQVLVRWLRAAFVVPRHLFGQFFCCKGEQLFAVTVELGHPATGALFRN